MKEKDRRSLRFRAAMLFWFLVVIGSVLVARLFHFQVREGASLAAGARDR